MTPGKLDLDLYRGDTYSWRVHLWASQDKTLPVDLFGAAVEAEIRDKFNSAMIMHMQCAVQLPNIIFMYLLAGEWPGFPSTIGVWDLEVTFPNGDVKTQLAGNVKVTADVTNSRIIPGRVLTPNRMYHR